MRSVASPCCRPLRSIIATRLSRPKWPAAIAASQMLPSWSSPSPVSTYVRLVEASMRAARAMPTATGRPCPSGPVFVSTPGTLLRSGWPFNRDSGAMKVLSSAAAKNPASASVA